MEFEYMEFPTTVKELAAEIIKACNDYKARRIGNNKLKQVIMYYAAQFPEKFFNASDLNPTVKKTIGSQRVAIVNKMLEGYQNTIYQGGEGYARK